MGDSVQRRELCHPDRVRQLPGILAPRLYSGNVVSLEYMRTRCGERWPSMEEGETRAFYRMAQVQSKQLKDQNGNLDKLLKAVEGTFGDVEANNSENEFRNSKKGKRIAEADGDEKMRNCVSEGNVN